jgi:hypothetical protein
MVPNEDDARQDASELNVVGEEVFGVAPLVLAADVFSSSSFLPSSSDKHSSGPGDAFRDALPWLLLPLWLLLVLLLLLLLSQ